MVMPVRVTDLALLALLALLATATAIAPGPSRAQSAPAASPGDGQAPTLPFRHRKQSLERPVRLLMVSDSHDSLEFVPRIRALSQRLKVDAVIHAGDLQQFGTEHEWHAVQATWARWPRPLLVASGNHDHRRDGFARLQSRFGPLPRRETIAGLGIVLLDDGEYQLGSQLAWLDRTLSRDPDRRTLVVLHVPMRVAPVLRWLGTLDWLPVGPLMRVLKRDPDKREDHLSLPERERTGLVRVLARHRVDAVCSGHLHMRALDLENPGAPALALGAAGSFIPGSGYSHEVLLVTVHDRGLQILPIRLDDPLQDPVTLVRGWRRYVHQARRLAAGEGP